MGSLAKCFFRTVCRNSVESSRKFNKKTSLTTSGKGAEILRKLRKFRGKLRKCFCNGPFPNDPISELLKRAGGGGVGTGKGTGKSMRTRLSKLPFSLSPMSELARRFQVFSSSTTCPFLEHITPSLQAPAENLMDDLQKLQPAPKYHTKGCSH